MRLRIYGLVLVALSCGPVCASAAQAAGYSWSGEAPASDFNWSAGANWAGGHAPSGSTARLTFPVLTGCASTKTCYTSFNDLTSFRTAALAFDDGAGYVIGGNALTLGIPGAPVNGIIAAPTTKSFDQGSQLAIPMTLGAPQTWSISGGNHAAPVYLSGGVSGSGDALAIKLVNGGILSLADNVEVGPVTVSGGGTLVDGAGFSPSDQGSLNSTDHNKVTISQSGLTTDKGTVGPLTAIGSRILVGGSEELPAGSLGVTGWLNLTSNTALSLYLNGSGTTAGQDYSSFNAEGNEALGGSLTLEGAAPNGDCPGLHKGDVDTLMSALGTVSGKFAGIANGTTIPVSCTGGSEPTVTIHYTTHAVTATVATAPAEAPVCNKVTSTTKENTPVSVKFPCSENSTEKLTYKVTAQPGHGSLGIIDQATGTVTYTPHAGYTGEDYFQIQATNAQGASNSAWAYVNVT
jgi:hypothetical protein